MGRVPMTREQQRVLLESVTERHAALLTRLAADPEVQKMISESPSQD